MKLRFRIGDRVRLTNEAAQNENYSKIVDRVLIVSAISTAYMPAKEFFAKGKPAGFHPGFDSSSDCALYDCEHCNFSLYDWELEAA